MTVWILHQNLMPQEEESIMQRVMLRLPFDGLPDLTHVHSEQEARLMLRMLYPDDPPEAISGHLQRFWTYYAALQPEDLVVVPLPASRSVAIGEIHGKYSYRAGDNGEDIHEIAVRWHKRVSMTRFRKFKDMFSSALPMSEVIREDARIAIRDQLPYRYNRFAKWKWILAIFFLLGLVRLLQRIGHS